MNGVLWELTLNIGMLSLMANMMTKLKMFQSLLIDRKESMLRKTVLAVILGLVCIFSTSSGVHLDNVIVNTRVIGALAAGIIGGPYVGMLTGIIGGVHRYFYDVGGFTTVACSLSTVLAGILGAFISPFFLRGKWNLLSIALLTALAEGLHMLLILGLSRPYPIAVETVRSIAGPMILLNSVGMVIFISTIKSVFEEKDVASEGKLRLALAVAEKSLPFFRKGMSNPAEMSEAASVLLSSTPFSGIMIADRQRILARDSKDARLDLDQEETILTISRRAMEERETVMISSESPMPELAGLLKYYSLLAAPLIQMNQPVGCLIVFVRRKWLRQETDVSLVKGLAALLSTQLELSEIEYQKRLRHKAELSALQSQVNPHFLYNALNTLACICRENPSRARELLLTMATYYRQTLESNQPMITLGEEIQQVGNYLVLEKARFEDKLNVKVEIPSTEEFMVPPLILQPLVENAVKYGADTRGNRNIRIRMIKERCETKIIIADQGPGFDPEILSHLNKSEEQPKGLTRGYTHIGLTNVRKRLKSVYGEEGILDIRSTGEGSEVILRIPNFAEGCPRQTRKEYVQ